MVEIGTIIESVSYLLQKLGKTDKVKIIKLLFFADKYHLVKYGRTVTNDDYWAMPHGPVGSNIKDVLEFNNSTMSENELRLAKSRFTPTAFKKSFKVQSSFDANLCNFLSETDIEALDFVIENFGHMGTWEIRDYSHLYPEWKQYEESFKNGQTRREKLCLNELVSVIATDPYDFSDEDLTETKKILMGAYE